ncbi:radical SAM protein [Candidatus Woesearchaeota archaeon]|nr:radical SAM protein [Candidatus Woesearchaeota archaeon]
MEVQTYSIVIGTEACNASCPYCVSKMTPQLGVENKHVDVNWRNFDIAARYAKDCGASTVLLTGKGEPTLFPELITDYMKHLKDYKFPFTELQTNGITLAEPAYDKYLKEWYDHGMTLVAISIAHYDAEKNREIYLPKRKQYFDLEGLISKLHSQKFGVRLSCTMLKEYIDDITELEELVRFAKKNDVEQLTLRPVRKPESSRNDEISDWVGKHAVDNDALKRIKDHLDTNATLLMELAHGAAVYDLGGQNICFTDALTIDPKSSQIRQLIFFPDGHLRYDWQYQGAILL